MSEQEKRNNITPILLIAVIILVSAIIWAARRPKTDENTSYIQQASIEQPHVHNHDTHTENPAKTTKNADSDTERKLSMHDVIRNANGWGPVYQRWYGKQAPDFALTDLNGKTHKLSDYRGKNVMLVFWATWCPPCIVEVPHLIALRDMVSKDKLAILAISNEHQNLVKKFVKKKKMNYTVFSGNAGHIPAPYNTINSLPSSFFIDSEGKIKIATSGMMSLGDTKAILRAEWKK